MGARRSPANGGKRPPQCMLSLSASPSKRRKVDSDGTAIVGGTLSGSPGLESKTGTVLARPQLPPPLGIQVLKSPLKEKAPCGESDAIESTECMITSPGFTEGVSSSHMTLVSGKASRTYKSKAKGSRDGLQAPISNARSPGTPPPWSHPSTVPPSSPVYGGNPQVMLPRPQDNCYHPDVHHVEEQPRYGISLYGRDANSTAAPTSENQHHGSFQLSRNMQLPFHYAASVIGSAGYKISYIRKHSGAIRSIQEGVPGGSTVDHRECLTSSNRSARDQEFIHSNHCKPNVCQRN